MFLGYYQLGDMLPLRFWSRNAAGTPVKPDAAPAVILVAENGTVVHSLQLPVEDAQRITAYFHHAISLEGQFSPQRYTVQYIWVISTVVLSATEEFEVLPGGDTNGAGIAMHFFRQASDDYVLLQDDTGRLNRLRGPEVRNAHA